MRVHRDEPLSQLKKKLNQLVIAVSSLTQSQQLLLVFAIYFVTKMLFSIKKEPTADIIQKVDDLSKEIREIKAMLESVLNMSELSMTREMDHIGFLNQADQ